MQTRNVIVGVAALLFSSLSIAEDTQQSAVVHMTNAWYVSAGRVSFDPEVAAEEGVDDSATYIRIAWQGESDPFVYGAGISGYLYSDNRDFRQNVEDNFGNRSTASSSADAFNLFFEGGYSYDVSPNLSLDVLGGVELVLQSERGIANCTDCASSDIDINAGPYVTPRVKFIADNGLMLAATYHQYFGGDVESAFSVTFGWVY